MRLSGGEQDFPAVTIHFNSPAPVEEEAHYTGSIIFSIFVFIYILLSAYQML